MPPHGHGGDDEEEITPRLDGPPFFDIRAPQGEGFPVDFASAEKHLGPGKLTEAEYRRSLEMINSVYLPVAKRSFMFLKLGNICMMGGFVLMIAMGIIGGTPDSRKVVFSVAFIIFLCGMGSLLYSKWIEQGTIRQGAEAVKKVVDGMVNPEYANSAHRITWVVTVQVLKSAAWQFGKEIVQRPVLTIYALRSPNAEGTLTDWELPDQLMHGVMIKEELHQGEVPLH